ncbi:MAG TPA: hypothetical protein VND64_20555 [Pirellulales bacterium]|nr:hypothetical protein [Pirellulales bacterium]
METLSLGNVAVTDAGLSQIEHLTALRMLYLGRTQITDAGLVHLHNLKQLTDLDVQSTRISDVGLLELERVKSLQRLNIHECNVTLDGVRRFQMAVPSCDVTWLIISSRQELEAWRKDGDEGVLEFRRTHDPTDDRRAVPFVIRSD